MAIASTWKTRSSGRNSLTILVRKVNGGKGKRGFSISSSTSMEEYTRYSITLMPPRSKRKIGFSAAFVKRTRSRIRELRYTTKWSRKMGDSGVLGVLLITCEGYRPAVLIVTNGVRHSLYYCSSVCVWYVEIQSIKRCVTLPGIHPCPFIEVAD